MSRDITQAGAPAGRNWALREAKRVLKPDGWLSLVFSNSSGEMWALVRRAVHAAGFCLERVAVLDKGQRSISLAPEGAGLQDGART